MFDKLITYIIITFKSILGGVEYSAHTCSSGWYMCVPEGSEIDTGYFPKLPFILLFYIESLIEPGVLQLSTLAGQGAPVICTSPSPFCNTSIIDVHRQHLTFTGVLESQNQVFRLAQHIGY